MKIENPQVLPVLRTGIKRQKTWKFETTHSIIWWNRNKNNTKLFKTVMASRNLITCTRNRTLLALSSLVPDPPRFSNGWWLYYHRYHQPFENPGGAGSGKLVKRLPTKTCPGRAGKKDQRSHAKKIQNRGQGILWHFVGCSASWGGKWKWCFPAIKKHEHETNEACVISSDS